MTEMFENASELARSQARRGFRLCSNRLQLRIAGNGTQLFADQTPQIPLRLEAGPPRHEQHLAPAASVIILNVAGVTTKVTSMDAKVPTGRRDHHRPIALSWKGSDRERSLRDSGIEVAGRVPWGTHLSVFCETKDDIMEAAISYFRPATLSNEQCIWIVSEPLNVPDVLRALRAVPALERLRSKAALEIVDGTSWYEGRDGFDRKKVIDAWYERSASAVEQGFDGVRAFGNPLWRNARLWRSVNSYEGELERVISSRPILMLCAYMIKESWPDDVFDVARTHQCVIARRSGKWEILKTRHAEKARKEIALLNDDLNRLSHLDSGLTERELVVLAQIVKGASSKGAARALGISSRTVEFHRANAMQKLGAKNAAELVRIVLKGR